MHAICGEVPKCYVGIRGKLRRTYSKHARPTSIEDWNHANRNADRKEAQCKACLHLWGSLQRHGATERQKQVGKPIDCCSTDWSYDRQAWRIAKWVSCLHPIRTLSRLQV